MVEDEMGTYLDKYLQCSIMKLVSIPSPIRSWIDKLRDSRLTKVPLRAFVKLNGPENIAWLFLCPEF